MQILLYIREPWINSRWQFGAYPWQSICILCYKSYNLWYHLLFSSSFLRLIFSFLRLFSSLKILSIFWSFEQYYISIEPNIDGRSFNRNFRTFREKKLFLIMKLIEKILVEKNFSFVRKMQWKLLVGCQLYVNYLL